MPSPSITSKKPTIVSLIPPKTTGLTQKKLLDYFVNSWELYELLFTSIKSDETFYDQPDPLRHPLVFYLGHTAAFYINKLVISGLINEEDRINPYFERIFEQGVDPAKSDELGSESWPGIQEVRAFRDEVYSTVIKVIRQLEIPEKINSDHPIWAMHMGIEHDRIHFETSSVLIRQLDIEKVVKPNLWKYAPINQTKFENPWVLVGETTVELGKPEQTDIFGWDNEEGFLKIEVPQFKASKNLISNNEFLEFVEAGGYKNSSFWSEEGWKWCEKHNVERPRFWTKGSEPLKYRAMFDELEFPWNWPVEVNAHEAHAFCIWKGEGTRLLSEAEFKAIENQFPTGKLDNYIPIHSNINLRYGSPESVQSNEETSNQNEVSSSNGNVWCWLSDNFYSLPGFKIHPYYKDFSEPYMDQEHSMMAGGSWATTGAGASTFYRLWFRKHFYQHAGFRIARNTGE